MTFEQYKKRKEAIAGWYDTYVNETCTKLSRFGHLMEYHLNKSDRYLMGRCKRIHKNTSSFVGTPEDVMALIRGCLLENREELIEYLANEEDTEPWELVGVIHGNITGKVITTSPEHDWKQGALPCSEYLISIKKDPHAANHFVITSAYPFF